MHLREDEFKTGFDCLWRSDIHKLELVVAFLQIAKVIRVVAEEMVTKTISVESLVVHVFGLDVVQQGIWEVALAVDVFLTLLATSKVRVQVSNFVCSEIHGIIGANLMLKL